MVTELLLDNGAQGSAGIGLQCATNSLPVRSRRRGSFATADTENYLWNNGLQVRIRHCDSAYVTFIASRHQVHHDFEPMIVPDLTNSVRLQRDTPSHPRYAKDEEPKTTRPTDSRLQTYQVMAYARESTSPTKHVDHPDSPGIPKAPQPNFASTGFRRLLQRICTSRTIPRNFNAIP